MHLDITLYGPSHHFWKTRWSVWFYWPCEHSSGGVGFKVPFFHICFMWKKIGYGRSFEFEKGKN